MNVHAAGQIDFTREKPERVRRLPVSTAPINWDALRLVVERSTGTSLEKKLMLTRFLKAVRVHGIEALTPQWRYSYCCARLALGDFSDYFGWEFRDYLQDGTGNAWAASMYWDETWLPKWGGGSVKRLLIVGEQGLGDQIFYASMLPECLVRCREVIYECDDRLHNVISWPWLKLVSERPFEDRREAYGPIDAFIPAADLMRMFRRHVRHFPGRAYLKANPERVREFEAYRGRVGVAWKGRQGGIDPLVLGIDRPVSLQYRATHPDIESPPLDLWSDVEGMVALCSVLSRVVTVPTTIHHVAGAVGTKTQIIVPSIAGETNQLAWDYSAGIANGRLPWYADCEVFKDAEDWRLRGRSVA